jgi:dihydroorotate dehydrogenase electron transfer subunit
MVKLLTGRIVAHEPLASAIDRLVLHTDQPLESLPAQFVRLTFPTTRDPYLPRPFVVFGEERETLVLVIQVRGRFTQALVAAPPGTDLEVSGPHGAVFSLPPSDRTLFVGGGVGTAVLNRFQDPLAEQHFLLGARSKDSVWFSTCFPKQRTQIATDDGSLGERGTLLDLLPGVIETWKPNQILAGGPAALLAGVARLAREKGLPSYVSLEERMACGVGLCLSCVVPLLQEGRLRNARVCHEGPVFPAEDVVFDAA